VQLKYQQNKRFGRNDEISTFKSILDPDVPNGRWLRLHISYPAELF
jgi:hypothetical protein